MLLLSRDTGRKIITNKQDAIGLRMPPVEKHIKAISCLQITLSQAGDEPAEVLCPKTDGYCKCDPIRVIMVEIRHQARGISSSRDEKQSGTFHLFWCFFFIWHMTAAISVVSVTDLGQRDVANLSFAVFVLADIRRVGFIPHQSEIFSHRKGTEMSFGCFPVIIWAFQAQRWMITQLFLSKITMYYFCCSLLAAPSVLKLLCPYILFCFHCVVQSCFSPGLW